MSLCLLEEGMAIRSNILPWRILWTEEPGTLQSTESQRVGHHWMNNTFTCAQYWRVLPTKSGLKKAAFSFCLPPSISLKVHSFYRMSFIIFPHYQIQTHQQTNKKPCSRKVPVSPKFNKTLSLKFLSPYVPILSLFATLTGLLAQSPSPHFHPRFRALCTLRDRSLTYTSFRTWTHLLPDIFPSLCLPGTIHFLLPKNSPPLLSFAPLVVQGNAFSHPSLSTLLTWQSESDFQLHQIPLPLLSWTRSLSQEAPCEAGGGLSLSWVSFSGCPQPSRSMHWALCAFSSSCVG